MGESSAADRFDGSPLTVQVDVTNTGNFPAKEIVQFYVRPDHEGGIIRPVRELKGYGKIALAPGETGTVTVVLDRRSFACWDERIHDWHVEGGRYVIEAAASSRDIRLCAAVEAEGEPLRIPVTGDTIFGEILAIPGARELLSGLFRRPQHEDGDSDAARDAVSQEMMEAMMHDMPLHALCSFNPDTSREQLEALVDRLNSLQGL